MIGGSVHETVSEKLKAMSGRIGDLKPIMTAMGRHMQISVRANFDAGGRPNPWTQAKFEVESREETEWRRGYRIRGGRARRRQGRARMGGLLVLTGDLRSHIGFTAEPADLVIWARPSNDGIKAPVHQYGATGAGRGHNVTIPARPYLLFLEGDIEYFRKLADGWIRVGTGGA